MKGKIKILIEKSIKELQKPARIATRSVAGGEGTFPEFKIPEFKVEKPENQTFGDYATNVALMIAKEAKQNPREIAEKLKSKILNTNYKVLERVEVAGPGFINFFVSEKYLQKQIGEILTQKEKFGQSKIGKNKKTNLEFISANPTSPLHVGTARGAFFGDCLANVLGKAGYKVSREYYINDSRNSNQIQEMGRTALGEGESYLTPYLKDLILKLKPHLKKFRSETDAGFFLAQNVLGDIKKFTKEKAKITFDFWVSEQNLLRESRIKIIYEFLKKKKMVYEKDGAYWLDLSKFNQKDEVLIRQTGQSTYFLSDIAYHKYKIERGFKKMINIWGADHQGHVPRAKTMMKILGYKGDFEVLITQVVSFKGAKMSKREGKIITLEWLIDEVGLDAARFFYLTKSLDTQMEFDIELAKEKNEKSPVFYIQYAHARICSILNKTKGLKLKTINYKLLMHSSELGLIKQLIRFPEIIEETAKDYQIQRIPQYAIDLATSFHQFYRDCQVISEDGELTKARLSLIFATKIILENTLDLMGISAPEKM